IMADLNIPTNDAPVEQAHVVAPPTRTDDHDIEALSNAGGPISKETDGPRCDTKRLRENLMAPHGRGTLLVVHQFFRASRRSSMISAIYFAAVFGNLLCFNSSTVVCKLVSLV
ncbi:hypothetical protein Tco_0736073, partial [Tanacetum coccineum]